MDAQFSFWLLAWIGRLWPFVMASVALIFVYKKVRNAVAFLCSQPLFVLESNG
jgi:hypothetical protein